MCNTKRFHYFVTWNDARDGAIHVAWLGGEYSHPDDRHDIAISGAQSNFAPVLRATPNYLYVLWIAKNGSIQYAINSNDSSFAGSMAHALGVTEPTGAAMGITAAIAGSNIVLTTHGSNKDGLLYAVTTMDKEGLLTTTTLEKVPAKSADYPFVVALSDSVVRLTWRGYKDEGIYYADVRLTSGDWTKTRQLYKVKSRVSPAVYRVFNSDKLFYIWKGGKNDNRLYYSTEEGGQMPAFETKLPSYFLTPAAVSICNFDRQKFILAYTGVDNKLYLSYFTNYNPARWMEESLYPRKAGYSLQDIVIPGAHDAGMSVLTAVGGQQIIFQPFLRERSVRRQGCPVHHRYPGPGPDLPR